MGGPFMAKAPPPMPDKAPAIIPFLKLPFILNLLLKKIKYTDNAANAAPKNLRITDTSTDAVTYIVTHANIK